MGLLMCHVMGGELFTSNAAFLPVAALEGRLPLARLLFWLGRGLAMPRHCAPLNRLRRRHGLPALRADLRSAYTDADQNINADADTFNYTNFNKHTYEHSKCDTNHHPNKNNNAYTDFNTDTNIKSSSTI